MVIKKREKTIAMVAGIALAVLVLDQYVLSPYLVANERANADLAAAIKRDSEAQKLLANRTRVERAWREMLAGGLYTDASASESQALHALRDWGQNARVELQSLKPDRLGRVGDFSQIRVQVSGIGTTAAIGRFLEMIESAAFPMKINDIRLTSRKEGTDDLTFALNVSTIVFTPAPEKNAAARALPKGEAK